MSFLELYSRSEPRTDAELRDLFPSRSDVLTQISAQRFSDIIIVGGGIHGAMFARLAALHGLRVILLERRDYAWATSSRTSKMAHGGLRYLEMFDFKQVIEGIKAREELLQTAPHLVHAHEFLLPILENQAWFKFKAGIGFKIYDLFLRDLTRRHRWLTREELQPQLRTIGKLPVSGGYLFSDAIMDDARLVVENIVAARQEGALCLNYARVLALKQLDDGSTVVGWRDELSGKTHESHTGTVINCAGPWTPSVGRLSSSTSNTELRYSRGIHLLFNQLWSHPALMRYSAKKGQHYFIWPHFSGTLVGPTDTEVATLDDDPIPQRNEVQALLGSLEQDFPALNLNRSTLHFGYAGIRSLPLRNSSKSTGETSRRHSWIYTRGMLSLLGGKFTTASWTVLEGFRLLCKMAGVTLRHADLKTRKLPGAALSEAQQEFIEDCRASQIPDQIASATISRLGSRVRFLKDAGDLRVIGNYLLSGEVRLAAIVEQVECLEDLVRRRVGLEYMPEQGFSCWNELSIELVRCRPELGQALKIEEYHNKINMIREQLDLIPLPAMPTTQFLVKAQL